MVRHTDWTEHREAMFLDLGTHVPARAIPAEFVSTRVDANDVILWDII